MGPAPRQRLGGPKGALGVLRGPRGFRWEGLRLGKPGWFSGLQAPPLPSALQLHLCGGPESRSWHLSPEKEQRHPRWRGRWRLALGKVWVCRRENRSNLNITAHPLHIAPPLLSDVSAHPPSALRKEAGPAHAGPSLPPCPGLSLPPCPGWSCSQSCRCPRGRKVSSGSCLHDTDSKPSFPLLQSGHSRGRQAGEEPGCP